MKPSELRALVCGGSTGIGFAVAEELTRQGYNVTILSRDEKNLQQAVNQIEKQTGRQIKSLNCDLENLDQLTQVINSDLNQNGSYQILINNTGGAPSGPLLEADIGQFLVAMTRHLFASHTLVKLLVPGMLKSQFGRIINIVSTSVREPIPGLGVSNTVRGAVAGWAKTLATELPPPITINNVLPGYTKTARLEQLKSKTAARLKKSESQIEGEWIASTPLGRLAEPSEVANAVVFLASPQGSYIRGVSLAVDGGRMRSI